MTQLLRNLRLPAIIGLVVILPFMVLEYVNRREFHEGYPLQLFGILWLLGTGFVFTLLPIVRGMRAGKSLLRSPIGQAFKVALLIVFAWIWIGVVMDQMRCFLGVPNCD